MRTAALHGSVATLVIILSFSHMRWMYGMCVYSQLFIRRHEWLVNDAITIYYHVPVCIHRSRENISCIQSMTFEALKDFSSHISIDRLASWRESISVGCHSVCYIAGIGDCFSLQRHPFRWVPYIYQLEPAFCPTPKISGPLIHHHYYLFLFFFVLSFSF